eukprot:GHVS01028078.1.p1 GENE.GHVS01028078.1~~GHVS01028078.1.p1  ORF type:complete len:252 (+),score=26.44 GHVS01028078.1:4-759(+)
MEYFPDWSCAVCLEILREPCTLKCTHSFCQHCLVGVRKCPLCRVAIRGRLSVKKLLKKGLENQRVQCRVCQIRLPLREATVHPCPGGIPVWTDSRLPAPASPHPPPRHQPPPSPPSVVDGSLDASPKRRRLGGEDDGGRTARRSRADEQRRDDMNVYSVDDDAFDCPLCPCGDLSEERFVLHILARHRDALSNEICPICESKPVNPDASVVFDFVHHVRIHHASGIAAAQPIPNPEDNDIHLALMRSRHDW